MCAEAKVEELGFQLPAPFPPAGTYVNAVRTGGLLVLAGHIPIGADQQVVLGKLGDDLDVEAGRAAARLAALSALATLRSELGSLDRVARIVSLRGVVNATPDFTGHTQVIDGASDVFVAVFGENGRHARLAVGVSSLPANLALEIELLVEVDDT
jgi:enamine deaminase RidA (YjgF/YER057c/UK114 family)